MEQLGKKLRGISESWNLYQEIGKDRKNHPMFMKNRKKTENIVKEDV